MPPQRSPFHTYTSKSTPSLITRIALNAEHYCMNSLREAHREAERIGDIETAKKIKQALDERKRKEQEKKERIIQQMVIVSENRNKAVSEKGKFQSLHGRYSCWSKIPHSPPDLTEGYLVVDGGTDIMTPLPEVLPLPGDKRNSVSPRILRMKNEDLQLIEPSSDPDKGTALYYKDSETPVFIVAPKNVSKDRLKLHVPKEHKAIRKAARKLLGKREGTLGVFRQQDMLEWGCRGWIRLLGAESPTRFTRNLDALETCRRCTQRTRSHPKTGITYGACNSPVYTMRPSAFNITSSQRCQMAKIQGVS